MASKASNETIIRVTGEHSTGYLGVINMTGGDAIDCVLGGQGMQGITADPYFLLTVS